MVKIRAWNKQQNKWKLTSIALLIFAGLMKLTLTDPKTGGDLLLFSREQEFDRFFYTRDREKKYFTIAWNHGEQQTVTIDGEAHVFPPGYDPPPDVRPVLLF